MIDNENNNLHRSEDLVQATAQYLHDYELLTCQSQLVGKLLEVQRTDGWTLEHIANLRSSDSENSSSKMVELDDIREWWLVSGYLGNLLSGIGQPVLRNDFGTWWGRTRTGQCVLHDGILQKIARQILHCSGA